MWLRTENSLDMAAFHEVTLGEDDRIEEPQRRGDRRARVALHAQQPPYHHFQALNLSVTTTNNSLATIFPQHRY